MISFKHSGDFRKTSSYFVKTSKFPKTTNFKSYGEAGVQALNSATPRDTGKTAQSWFYKIHKHGGVHTISFHNSNIRDGVSIAIILQYGHASRNGSWVRGRDYINPAIRPIFDKLAAEAWKEVSSI